MSSLDKVLWDPSTTVASFSAVGFRRDGRMICVAIKKEFTISEFTQHMQDHLDVTDAVLCGGSADVQQWIRGLRPVIAKSRKHSTNPGSHRRLNSVFTLRLTTTETGWTPLHFASLRGDVSLCERLIDSGCDLDARTDKWRSSPLHRAAKGGSAEVIECLVRAGADVNAQARGRYTPLHDAATYGHVSCIKALLERGADGSARSTNGRSILHYAAGYGHVACVRFVLRNAERFRGMKDIECWTDAKGLRAVDLAEKWEQTDVLLMMKEWGGASCTRSDDRKTKRRRASRRG